MSLKRGTAFVTVVMFTIVSEHILQAMEAQFQQPSSRSGTSAFGFAIDANSIVGVKIEFKDGQHSYSTGCAIMVRTATTTYISVVIPWSTWEGIEIEPRRVAAVRIILGDQQITFGPGQAQALIIRPVPKDFALLRINVEALLKPIPLANTAMIGDVKQGADRTGAVTMGMTAMWQNGVIVQRPFHIIKYERDETFFHAIVENENKHMDVGKGTLFLIRMARQVYLAGIQVGYDSRMGRNKVAVIDKRLSLIFPRETEPDYGRQ